MQGGPGTQGLLGLFGEQVGVAFDKENKRYIVQGGYGSEPAVDITRAVEKDKVRKQ